MGPPLSPRETRRSGRRSAPSVSASASKSPDSDQPPPPPPPLPPPKERASSSRNTLSSTNNRGKRNKIDEDDETVEDRKHTSGSSASSASTNGNVGKPKRKGTASSKDKDKGSNTSGAADDVEAVTADDQPQDPGEDDEEQGITRCVCGSTGPFPFPRFSSFFFRDHRQLVPQKTTQMPENSWSNAKNAKSGSMDRAWVIKLKPRSPRTTITVSCADLTCMSNSSSTPCLLHPLIIEP